MKKNATKIGLMALVIAPALVFAGTISKAHFFNYDLAATKSSTATFTEDDSALVYQRNRVQVITLQHDGDANNCSFCKLEITGKKRVFLGLYSTIGSNTIKTPKVGSYDGANYGNVGTGTFQYTIKNPSTLKTTGNLQVYTDNSN